MDMTMNVNGVEELMAALQTMDPAVMDAFGGVMVALFVIAGVAFAITVIRYLIQAIGYAAMYRKAGVAPWKAFIPVYNTYNNYKLSWNGKLFFLTAALSIASSVLSVFTEGAMAFVSMAASIGLIYMVVKQNIKMAKLFGKGAGTGIALVLFPGITSLILGLGKAEFQGEMIENN